MEVLGIDIGGTGMKGALVNAETGEMTTERFRISTPGSRDPQEMAGVVQEIIDHFSYSGPVGCGFPTIVKNGVCTSPGNLNPDWVGTNIESLFSNKTGLDFKVVNDADAAGFAAMEYGVGKGKQGFVLMITVGTGLGSGAFDDLEPGQVPGLCAICERHYWIWHSGVNKGLSADDAAGTAGAVHDHGGIGGRGQIMHAVR